MSIVLTKSKHKIHFGSQNLKCESNKLFQDCMKVEGTVCAH